MKLKLSFIALLVFGLVLKSCQKDPVLTVDESKPTPYVLETKASYPPFNLPVDNPLTIEGVALGRMLFYDPILSLDSTMSCASCHRQNSAFTDGRRVSKGIRGQLLTRNSMPLFNLMWQKKFFWDGRSNTLREQVLVPIQAHNEMDLNLFAMTQKLRNDARYKEHFNKAFPGEEIDPELTAKSLEQFLITMISFNAPLDQLKGRTDTLNFISASALRGLNLFMQPLENGGADCFHCHSNLPFFGITSEGGSMANNGLDLSFTDNGFGNVTGKQEDNGKFKIPSLRNVALTPPYMHDGRFANLEEVIDFYSSGIQLQSPNLDINILTHNKQLNLSTQQKEDLVEFLKALTDTEFANNPDFSSPF
jgi:cytochrome c peroxidase